MGCVLFNVLVVLKFVELLEVKFVEQGLLLGDVLECEFDVVFGNGGLGCLVVCFLDSFVELELLFFGYGLCYCYGIFVQVIQQGCQFE